MGAPFTAVSASHLSRDNYNNLVLIFQCLSCHLARIFRLVFFPGSFLRLVIFQPPYHLAQSFQCSVLSIGEMVNMAVGGSCFGIVLLYSSCHPSSLFQAT
jgi:hypothetical protein